MNNTLPALRVTRSDGSSYVTSMAAGVTLADAQAYFLGQTFTDEAASGNETKWTVTNVEPATAEPKPSATGRAAAFMQNPPAVFFIVLLTISAACLVGVLIP